MSKDVTGPQIPLQWDEGVSFMAVIRAVSQTAEEALFDFTDAETKQDVAEMLRAAFMFQRIYASLVQYVGMKKAQWTAAASANSNEETPST